MASRPQSLPAERGQGGELSRTQARVGDPNKKRALAGAAGALFQAVLIRAVQVVPVALKRTLFSPRSIGSREFTGPTILRRRPSTVGCRNHRKIISNKAEGKGFEPSTPFGASDFESDRWPIRIPSSDARHSRSPCGRAQDTALHPVGSAPQRPTGRIGQSLLVFRKAPGFLNNTPPSDMVRSLSVASSALLWRP